MDPRHLLALLLLAFVALALRVLAMRPRRLIVAASLALASSATALTCHHNPDPALTPDEHTRFHVADRLGSASLVLDHQGRVLTRDAADPYGASRLAWRADADTAAPTYRFTGKEDDALSGAIAIGARHYLPELGRWASPDPHFLLENPDAALATPGEANPYSYVGGNPVTFTDPTGRKGLAHGSENRPGVLDNYPDSPNSGFNGRMAAVARDRALAEYRGAQLASMALGVLDVALTGLDWAMTASDVVDTTSMAAGPIGWKFKAGKAVAKKGVRGLGKLVRGYADDAIRRVRSAGEKAMQLAPQGVKREPRVSSRTLRSRWEKEYKSGWPVDPNTGKKMEVSHEVPLADGGSNDVSNIRPRPRDEHVQMHKDRGDYGRWSQQRGTKK